MKLAAVQTRLETLAQGSPLLKDRPVLVEDKGNLVNELETALETQSLAVVVALSGGQARDGSTRTRTASDEKFELVIHRGQLDGVDVPSTLDVLEDLIERIHGTEVIADKPAAGFFQYVRHDLRDTGDGAYARVVEFTITRVITRQ